MSPNGGIFANTTESQGMEFDKVKAWLEAIQESYKVLNHEIDTKEVIFLFDSEYKLAMITHPLMLGGQSAIEYIHNALGTNTPTHQPDVLIPLLKLMQRGTKQLKGVKYLEQFL